MLSAVRPHEGAAAPFPVLAEVVAVTDSAPQPGPAERGPFAMFGALTGIASLSAVLVVGGAAVGLLVDRWTSAPHVFVFLGLALGVGAAVLATRTIVRRFFG